MAQYYPFSNFSYQDTGGITIGGVTYRGYRTVSISGNTRTITATDRTYVNGAHRYRISFAGFSYTCPETSYTAWQDRITVSGSVLTVDNSPVEKSQNSDSGGLLTITLDWSAKEIFPGDDHYDESDKDTDYKYHNIFVVASPTAGGSVESDYIGVFRGNSKTITATPNSGYRFVQWTSTDGSTSTSASHTFTVNNSATWTAHFVEDTYTVTVTTDGGGTVSGGGTFSSGSTCTITATPDDGYNFERWTANDGSSDVTTATHEFSVTNDVTWTAVFSEKIYTRILAYPEPYEGGVVTGDIGWFEVGTTCNLYAVAAMGYDFDHWEVDPSIGTVPTGTTYSFTVPQVSGGEVKFTAYFTQLTYTVAVVASPAAGGVVAGGGAFHYGDTCTITATPNAGYTFIKWKSSNGETSTHASYSFTVTADVTWTAYFGNGMILYSTTNDRILYGSSGTILYDG